MGQIWPMAHSLLTPAGLSPGPYLVPFLVLTFAHHHGPLSVPPSSFLPQTFALSDPSTCGSLDTVALAFTLVSA